MSLSLKGFLSDQFAKLNVTPVNLAGKTVVVTGSNVGKNIRIYYADCYFLILQKRIRC